MDSAAGQQPGQPAPAGQPVSPASEPVSPASQPSSAGPPAPGRQPAPASRLVSASACVMLFLLGVMEGVVGCFYYGSGPVPAAALAFDALLLVTSLLAASGMSSPSGGLMPAVGWFLASFVLAMGTKGGSVVITNTSAGKWFLYGGSAAAAAGAVAAFVRWSRPAPTQRGRLARRKTGQ